MANAAEIANAYVALTVRAPGVKKEIEKSLGGAAEAGDKAGTEIGSRMLGAAKSVLKVGAVALGAVVAAGVGTALVKGFQRLDAIDTAQAKLRGLGNDAGTVDQIMQNALASVKGTAFGLGDAATVAAQAVAAGIKPGAALEGVLKTVANNAAAAGTSLGDMGSIFSKAMSQANGVQNDVLSQLADRGIPIYQALADQLGVTSGEVFKLASDGKINFDQFAAAATSAAGTVASEMGGTWSGSFDNFMASLGRIGEGLLKGLFPQMKDGLQGVTEWLAPFEDGAKEVGAAIGEFVADAGPKLVQILQEIWKAGENVVQWVKDNTTWLVPLALGVGIAAGAFVVWTGAIAAWATVTKAAKTAMELFTEAIKKNPIGAIVSIILAVVGALVWFFTQTDEGKKIWAEFTRFLGEAWTNISGFFTSAWEGVIQPTFKAIGDIAVWLYESILKPVFDGIGAVVGWVAGLIKLNFDLTVNAFRLVGAIANWLWVNALKPAFDAIGSGVAFLWTNFVQPYFNLIGQIFQWVWANIISPIVGWIGDKLQILGLGFKVLYEGFVKPAWEGISGALQAGWNWIDQYVFTPFKIGIDLIARGFEVARAAIEKTWDGIRSAAAIPINFVLGTVWNNGLRSFWNDVVGTLGLNDMKLAAAPLVKFASGGVLPGYTPGRDVHEFYSPTGGRLALSGGEAIMRPEFTRAVGGAAGVARLNAMARSGQAFKDGGVFDEIGRFGGDIWNTVTGAVGKAMEFITNPGQAIQTHIIDGLLRPLLAGGPNPNIFQKTAGQLPINLMEAMIEPLKKSLPQGKGTAGMGWQAMWQLVQAAIPGATFNDGPRPAGTLTNTGSLSYHSLGRAIDIGPATMDTFNRALALFPTARELIFSPAGNRQLYNGQPYFWTGVNRDIHWDHVHIAMANGGVLPGMGKAKLYDQGGWLPNGGIAVNRSGRPEAVLNPDESAALRSGLGGGLSGMEITGTLHIGEDGLARLVDGRIQARDREVASVVRGRRRADA